jgi:hypothetical protein
MHKASQDDHKPAAGLQRCHRRSHLLRFLLLVLCQLDASQQRLHLSALPVGCCLQLLHCRKLSLPALQLSHCCLHIRVLVAQALRTLQLAHIVRLQDDQALKIGVRYGTCMLVDYQCNKCMPDAGNAGHSSWHVPLRDWLHDIDALCCLGGHLSNFQWQACSTGVSERVQSSQVAAHLLPDCICCPGHILITGKVIKMHRREASPA